MTLRTLLVTTCIVAAAACGGSSSLTGPTPTATSAPARTINVAGNLAFGDVAIGSSRSATITMTNSGNAPLTVSGLTVSGGLAAHITASWTSGVIGPGASQSSTIRFQPSTAGSFAGTLTVQGDHTAGSNTIGISGSAVPANTAAGTWSGHYVIERCDGTGSTQDLFCSATRGAYPTGSSLPMRLTLTQSGGSVTGTLSLGQVTGSVIGSISGTGDLTLSGTVSASGTAGRLTSWTTRVTGNHMSGNFGFDASFTGTPGVAAIRARLGPITK
jgi:hypothetical protein